MRTAGTAQKNGAARQLRYSANDEALTAHAIRAMCGTNRIGNYAHPDTCRTSCGRWSAGTELTLESDSHALHFSQRVRADRLLVAPRRRARQ